MDLNTQQAEPDYEDHFVDLKVGVDLGITNVAIKNVVEQISYNPMVGYIFSNLNSSPKYTVYPGMISVGVFEPQKILDKVRKGREEGYIVTLRVIANKVITALLPIYAVSVRSGGIDVQDPNSEATVFIKVVDFYIDAGTLYN